MEKEKPMIKAENVSFSYDTLSILKDVSFEIDEGDFVAILGPNGAGKTTLVKLIIGLLPMQQGALEIDGTSIRKLENNVIGYVPQRYTIDRLFPGTVKEILHSQSIEGTQIPHELGVHPLMQKKFIELSGGQQQRVLLALALQNKPKILILDEPTVGVDMKTEHEFFSLLKHVNKKHMITILLITHDVGMVPNLANKMMCINHNTFSMGSSDDGDAMISCVYDSHKDHQNDAHDGRMHEVKHA